MREPTGTSLRLAAALCAALVALAGCADDPEQPGKVPTKAAPSPTSSSPSPTPQTIEEEVEAAVRAYFAELTRAAQAGDPDRLRGLTAKSCPCYNATRVIMRASQMGGRLDGAEWNVRQIRVHDIAGDTAQAEVKYDVTPYKVVDGSGKILASIKAESSHRDYSVIKGHNGWIITNVVDLEA